MARTTDPALRNLTVYSVFTRNHSTSGDFDGLIADLDRIAGLGCGIIWLLPVHPIGEIRRKGEAGSPYAVSDYRGINPEYGDMDTFLRFIDEAHKRNLKVIIDVVYNHTSPDSLLNKVHPEWFWKNNEGVFGNRVGDWSDIVDLDYGSADLWDYQIETLKGWLREGVDGFRCDVAPLMPLSFWIEARAACDVVNPDAIWLAETVEGNFINTIRRSGFECLTDTETLRAFDIAYEYDLYPEWIRLMDGDIGLDAFIYKLRTQESVLCDTDLKLRFLENHDQRRAADLIKDPALLKQWTAYSMFAKGTALVYAGQEYAMSRKPGLFDRDPINWDAAESDSGREHCRFLSRLVEIRKDGIVRDGFYWYPEAPDGCIVAAYERRSPDGRLTGLRLGLFNVFPEEGTLLNCAAVWPELASEPVMRNLLTQLDISLDGGNLKAADMPLILDWGLTG